jgi:hypothetical protein
MPKIAEGQIIDGFIATAFASMNQYGLHGLAHIIIAKQIHYTKHKSTKHIS